MHALIIEQDVWVIMMIEDVLRDMGYESFDTARSFEGAVLAATRHCPDLITSDLRLDSGSGIDAVRHICSDTPIPAVFITATPWEIETGLDNAVIVPKPFGPAALKAGVKRATCLSPAGRLLPPASGRLGEADDPRHLRPVRSFPHQ